MSWPASSQTLANALTLTNATALSIKQRVQDLRDRSAAGDIQRQELLDIQSVLSAAIGNWNKAAALPGIVAYAQAQLGDPALDVSAEFTAMKNAATTLRDWIFTNFPRDAGSGAVLVNAVNQVGTVTPLTFTSAQLAQFRTQADTFLATIG